ncbi:MAG TPA: ABC transporter permease subunit [Chryseosolibacter sp.]|nr:ABC transporter permease subunit [Chryseosolibacter sp.]
MNIVKKVFHPLTQIKGRTSIALIAVEAAAALLLWEIFGSNGLIPTPSKIIASVFRIITTESFIDNLFSSLSLTMTGMGISILIALVVSYLALIPFFAPVAKFVVKCRYLTLTGLIFLFTLLTQDGHQLKLSLLIFGIVPFFVTSLLSIIESINSQEYELCKTLRMNNWQTMLEVVIIGRLDQVFEVMRQNFAIAWMMITMVEGLSMSEGGLGTLLIKSNKYIDLATVFAILVIIFALGIFFDYLLRNIRLWLFPYTKIQVRK